MAEKQQPGFWAQMAAMGREGIKDIRQTMNETFFGKAEHASEPGTPLNPTQHMVNNDLGVYGREQVDMSGDRPALPASMSKYQEFLKERISEAEARQDGKDRDRDR